MSKLRVGIIGCGRVSTVYKDAFEALSDKVDVCFAVDKILSRAEQFAKNFAGCEYSDNLDVLLQANLDVVHIATPHHLHKEQTIACLQAGIHVLCEKPIANTLQDADEMIRASEKTGKKLGIIFQNRYSDAPSKMKNVISSGKLGKLLGAWSNLNWHRPPSYYECDWKGKYATEGGGVLIDQAIHSLDLVRWLVGSEVAWVHGHTDNRVLKSVEVEDVANAVMEFENGCRYSLHACNYYISNSPIEIRIDGENGYVHLIGNKVDIKIGNETYLVTNHDAGEHYWGRSHKRQMIEFYESCLHNTAVSIDGAEGRKTLEMVLAVYQSSKKNEKIYLKEPEWV
jgi:predicted dehydrogenase